MGERKSRLSSLKEKHPYCCFCGGTNPTETVEHAPPKVLFRDKKRQKGLEFPACKRCNNGTSALDQVAALITLTMSGVDKNRYIRDRAYISKIAQGVRNNSPEVFDLLGLNKREYGTFLHPQHGILNLLELDPRLLTEWLSPWAAKIVAALWYQHSGSCIRERERISISWMTNASLLHSDADIQIAKMLSGADFLRQGSWESSDQFFYKHEVNVHERIGAFLVGTHDSSAFLGCVYPAHVEGELGSIGVHDHIFSTSAETGVTLVESGEA